MDPVLTIIAACFGAGAICALLAPAPFALRLWIAPLVLGAAAWAVQPVISPSPWDGLGEILIATFAAAWTLPFFVRGGVEAARVINRRTAARGQNIGPPPLSDRSRAWLRRIDIALVMAALAILAAGNLSAI